MVYKQINLVWRKLMAFSEIFKDNNDWNEKNILGFISFTVMCLYALLDLLTGLLDLPLALHEYIYNSFIWITLGSFGIGGLEKFSGTERAKVDQRSNGNKQLLNGWHINQNRLY